METGHIHTHIHNAVVVIHDIGEILMHLYVGKLHKLSQHILIIGHFIE